MGATVRGRNGKRSQLSVQFTPDQLAVLRGLASQYGVSLATVARWAFDDYIARIRAGEIVVQRPVTREQVPA